MQLFVSENLTWQFWFVISLSQTKTKLCGFSCQTLNLYKTSFQMKVQKCSNKKTLYIEVLFKYYLKSTRTKTINVLCFLTLQHMGENQNWTVYILWHSCISWLSCTSVKYGGHQSRNWQVYLIYSDYPTITHWISKEYYHLCTHWYRLMTPITVNNTALLTK